VDEVNAKAQCGLVEIAVRYYLILACPGKHYLSISASGRQGQVAANKLSVFTDIFESNFLVVYSAILAVLVLLHFF
jgi:hypothetical protein